MSEVSKVKKPSDEELEDPRSWDYDRPIRKRGTTGHRAIVSVAFSRDDFRQVSEFARRHSNSISEFIREAALRAIQREGGESSIFLPSWSAVRYVYPVPPPTVTTYKRSGVSGEDQPLGAATTTLTTA